MLPLRALAQLCLFAGWKGDLHQPFAGRQGIAVGKCVIPTITLLAFPLSLLLHPAKASLLLSSLLPYPQDHATVNSLRRAAAEKLRPKQASPSQSLHRSENGRFVCSVLYRSGEGAPAGKPFWLWPLHGKGRFQLGVAPRLLKHLSSSHFPAAGSDGTRDNSAVQGLGWWGGLAIYCPRRKYGFKSRLSYGWSTWCWSNSLLLSASIPWWNQGSRSLWKSP